MSNDILIPKGFGPAPKVLADVEDDDVASGVRAGFPSLVFPGRIWTMRYQRVDTPYLLESGDPAMTIEVAIIKTRENINHTYYIGGFDPNMKNRAPDCYATDGQIPDPQVPEETRQAPTCLQCPHNVVRETLSNDTKKVIKTKACQDRRKVAVVPMVDLADRNFDEYGGPMHLSLPPASLKNYMEYGERLKAMGYKTFNVITRMRFDLTVTHPKITFTPYRAMTEDEAAIVKELRQDPRTARVLNEEPFVKAIPEFEEEAERQAVQHTPSKPVVVKAPPPSPARGPAPIQAATTTTPPKAPPPPPPPPKVPGGHPVTQTVAAAVTNPAPRPVSQRVVQAPPPNIESEEGEEVLDASFDVVMPEGLDDELSQLLSGRK